MPIIIFILTIGAGVIIEAQLNPFNAHFGGIISNAIMGLYIIYEIRKMGKK